MTDYLEQYRSDLAPHFRAVHAVACDGRDRVAQAEIVPGGDERGLRRNAHAGAEKVAQRREAIFRITDYEAGGAWPQGEEFGEGAAYGGGVDQQVILQRQPDGTYEIKSAQGANRNLSVPGASTTIGADLQFTTDNDTDAQRWIIEPHGAGYRITSKNHLLRVLEADSAGTADSTLAQSGEYTGTTGNHQIWRLDTVSGGVVETFAYWNGDEDGVWTTNNGGDTNWATGYNRTTEFQHAFPKASLGCAARSQNRTTWRKDSSDAAKATAYGGAPRAAPHLETPPPGAVKLPSQVRSQAQLGTRKPLKVPRKLDKSASGFSLSRLDRSRCKAIQRERYRLN